MALTAADGTPRRMGEWNNARLGDRFGSLMSHARPTVALPIRALTEAVSVSACFGLLVATAGGPLLLSPSRRPTFATAVALTAVATAADKERGATVRPATEPLAQRRFGRRRCDFGTHLITIPRTADDRTEDRAFGADDVAGPLYAGKRLRKLRFLMTDNT